MFNLFKKTKKQKIFYSCVVDDHPKFYWQGYIFVNVLLYLAKVGGNRIFIHLTKSNVQFEKFLKSNNVNIKYIEPWGDKKYCNKLQQLETKEFIDADFVWFCDADIAITEDLSNIVKENQDKILGKIVDFTNPSIEKLKSIYDFFGMQYPKISTDTLTNDETFEGNFNGGLYGIPSKYIDSFGKSWKRYAKDMLESENIKDILAEKINHIDQISFSLALKNLNLPYKILGYEYNCPTHIKNIDLLDAKLESKAKVVHYHNNISNIGLLNIIEKKYIKEAICETNEIIKQYFNNAFFWSYRYATNPELGSGVGSRGDVAKYKLKLLKNIGLEKQKSVLDVGCGDLEIVKNLSFKAYTGVDISAQAVSNGKAKFPKFDFYNFELEKDKISSANTVLCLDVLIHQPTKQNYEELIKFVTTKANKRVVVSGYENAGDKSHMCFFYENLKQSLEKTGIFKYVYKIGEYRGLGVYVADKGELENTNMPNDISNEVIDEALNIKVINSDLLLETVTFSRSNFAWYTKHYPRLYEYPWILERLGRNLDGVKIADFGAGVTPLPLQLAQRGASVFTIDRHELKRDIKQIDQANEWGFFDYNAIDETIQSYNQSLDEKTFEKESLDVWYSVSVVEHMPAFIRRAIFKIMADTLKVNGRLLLTIDLVKDSNKLWNMAEGKIVEDESEHGTFESFVDELEKIGFEIEEKEIYRMP
ncbi:methyltransferase domain-containing protein, partial [Campylobacter sp. RM13119]|uniref:methyltransferase domain-containing protein n=1 Tax=Campylobacter californiensis TaxID=1032243 RepID=UPI00147275AC